MPIVKIPSQPRRCRRCGQTAAESGRYVLRRGLPTRSGGFYDAETCVRITDCRADEDALAKRRAQNNRLRAALDSAKNRRR